MKILTVCLGNICRSPLAQGILEKVIQEHQLDWKVDSAGTAAWHAGEQPDTRSIHIAKIHQIDISQQRARQFTQKDFQLFDHILVMDKSNLDHVRKLSSTQEEYRKVSLILSHSQPATQIEVPDPYYDNSFQRSYDLLYHACHAFVNVYKV